jgi:adenylate cyclase
MGTKKYLVRLFFPLVLTGILFVHSADIFTIPYVNQLEHSLYDTRVKLSAPRGEDARILIIAIDEESLEQQGHWPWTRDKLSLLLDQLFNYGVAVAGFDMLFAERDESADVDMLKQLASGEKDSDFRQRLNELAPMLDRDQQFAEALSRGPTVLGYYFDTSESTAFEIGELPYPAFDFDESMAASIYLPGAYGYTSNLDVLMSGAYSAGFINNPLIDDDGVVRRAPLLHEYGFGAYESLSLATAATYLNDISLPVFVDVSALAEGYPSLEALELAGQAIPIDAQGGVLVPYRGPAGSFPYISATKIMDGTMEDATLLDGAIVLIGATAPGLDDLRSTPFGSIYPGVEIHANVIAGLLDGSFKWAPAYTVAMEMMVVLFFGLLCTFLLPLLSPVLATIAAVVVTSAALGLNLYLWEVEQHVLPLAATLITIFGIYVLNMILGFLFESRTRAHMHDLFCQYVPPDLVTEMSHDPKNYSLASEKRTLSVLFSDIRGFTSISEKLDASELSDLLNRFLTPMTHVVHHSKGTIDKYMGDAIMAFWGAPVRDENHANQAVGAGLSMLEELDILNREFQEQGMPEVKIGVGVNTGSMSVGNMGSVFRRAYTVLGDAVNLGSRLEGLTKEYGVSFIVGEATTRSATDFLYKEIDCVRVKGKSEPITIFEVLGPQVGATEEQAGEAELFQAFLRVYRKMDWDRAEKILLEQNPNSNEIRLHQLYMDRISHYRDNPPSENWDGVFTHVTK